MRVAIVGSRGYSRSDKVREYVLALPSDTVVVSGGAAGVDSVAEITARKAGLKVDIYLPNWATLGRSAGFQRNVTIVENCDRVVAFWDGYSKGTSHTINLAHMAGKEVTIIREKEE